MSIEAGSGGSELPTSETHHMEILRTMIHIRLFKEKVGELSSAVRLHGVVRLCLGQEAVA
jgi:TPP-dependent pyruvate/acetoin dehydrogenase alpha subunit